MAPPFDGANPNHSVSALTLGSGGCIGVLFSTTFSLDLEVHYVSSLLAGCAVRFLDCLLGAWLLWLVCGCVYHYCDLDLLWPASVVLFLLLYHLRELVQGRYCRWSPTLVLYYCFMLFILLIIGMVFDLVSSSCCMGGPPGFSPNCLLVLAYLSGSSFFSWLLAIEELDEVCFGATLAVLFVCCLFAVVVPLSTARMASVAAILQPEVLSGCIDGWRTFGCCSIQLGLLDFLSLTYSLLCYY
ncbi:hypothetical protein Peur_023950 [Populus x canadensis]